MIGEASRSRNPAGRGGFFSNLLALANALATFFESRAALFATESKRALIQLILCAAALVAAVLFFALGYLFLIGMLVVAIAHAAEISVTWTALGAAVLHFILAVICVLVAVTRIKTNPFPQTAAELKKDREWLRNLDAASRPTR
jgi:uncharacterized membrane protein YqjE